MKIQKILKPKSVSEIIDGFSHKHNISEKELKNFIHQIKGVKSKRGLVRVLCCCFLFTFGLTMLINSGIAFLEKGYFWFPIKETENMLAFINIFWVVAWNVIAFFIVMFSIFTIINSYD